MEKSGGKTCFDVGKIGCCHCAAVFQMQVPKLCTDPDLSLFYILTLGTYSKFARENNFLALGVCSPQPCSSAGRRFAASRSRVQNYWRSFRFHNKYFDETRFHWESAFVREIPNPTSRLGFIFDFCVISRWVISKIRFPHPISVADTICGTRFDLQDSKRRALEIHFCVRICYMFPISKDRRSSCLLNFFLYIGNI